MSTKITCILVDDEPAALRLLEKYVGKIPFLKLIGTFNNPIEALQTIENNPVDLVFLDIQMPEITGIQLAKIIDKKTTIIFTTAYPQFALESYDVAAADYLLKPIEFERFYKAVLKVKQKNNRIKTAPQINNYFFFKTDGKNKFSKIFLDDILFFEGLKNYVSIYLKEQRIITYNTLKYIAKNLPETNFIQIHKSYIISLKNINKIENDVVWIKNKELPIGNTFRKTFFERITKNQF